MDTTIELPENHLTWEDIPNVHKDGMAMVVMSEPPSPPQIEDSSNVSNLE